MFTNVSLLDLGAIRVSAILRRADVKVNLFAKLELPQDSENSNRTRATSSSSPPALSKKAEAPPAIAFLRTE